VDDDFEFEFFPEQPDPAGDEPEELPREARSDPRRDPRPRSTPSQVFARRRAAALAVAAVIVLIVLIAVLTSGSGGGSGGEYGSYLAQITPIASDSQQAGATLAADLRAARTAAGRRGVVSKLDGLVQQTTDQITRLQALQVPPALSSEQAQALAALDLRLRGLQGLRNTLALALAGQSDASSSAVVSTQLDDLLTSDLVWEGVRASADAALQAQGQGPSFPASKFVTNRTSLLQSARTLVGPIGASTSGGVLSLGSTGPDVTSWQNALNEWLKIAAPTQTHVTADGSFGPSTQLVTQQLQTAQGLAPDGIVGTSTRRALELALTGTKTPASGTTLRLGDTGPAVVTWQTQLNRWLKLTTPTQTPLTTDGTFGTATQTATEQLQTAAGVTPSGQVDAATRRALETALAGQNTNTG
jgi:peptidoglycan hydrolase-like protein with peptidoglycan-binding domain